MDAINELRDVITLDVTAGYETRAQIIASAIDMLMGDYSHEWLDEQATRLTDEALARHKAEQALWKHSTDCDKLDEAFAELDRHGIVARQHFTCCQTCGHSEINAEIKATRVHRPVRGYVFFHWQDTESVVKNGYLYLAYGAVNGKERDSQWIASDIITALQRAGLEAEWKGSVRSRICIRDFVWQRRRI